MNDEPGEPQVIYMDSMPSGCLHLDLTPTSEPEMFTCDACGDTIRRWTASAPGLFLC